jgi:hypothetical protein
MYKRIPQGFSSRDIRESSFKYSGVTSRGPASGLLIDMPLTPIEASTRA